MLIRMRGAAPAEVLCATDDDLAAEHAAVLDLGPVVTTADHEALLDWVMFPQDPVRLPSGWEYRAWRRTGDLVAAPRGVGEVLADLTGHPVATAWWEDDSVPAIELIEGD